MTNLAAARESGVSLSSTVTSGTSTRAPLMDGIDVVFHLAAIRITQCAESRGWPWSAWWMAPSRCWRRPSGAVWQGGRFVLGLALRPGRAVPDRRAHHPYNNDTFYGAAKAFNEGMLRSFHAMYGLDYVALRYFNVYGPRMDVHGL